MYRLMSLVRTFDTKAINLQRTGKLGTYASCLGMRPLMWEQPRRCVRMTYSCPSTVSMARSSGGVSP